MLGGRDLVGLRERDLNAVRWTTVAFVFQGAMNSLNPVHRVDRQIAEPILAHEPGTSRAEALDRARSLLEQVGVAPARSRSYPHEFSGGMRQRVMIAMAPALEPRVLIMDEPTTALDVVMQRQIVEQVADLRERLGFSVIFITHDVSLLIEIADRIAIMYAGRIVEDAAAQQVYREPRHPYSRALLHSFPPLRGPRRELTGIPGAPPDVTRLAPGCPFAPRCAFAMDGCRVVNPVLGPTRFDEPGRQVACHLHELGTLPPELAQRG
jgi:peptide/nickel transport system ATP-binding protein